MANLLDSIIGGLRTGVNALGQVPPEAWLVGASFFNPSLNRRLPDLLTAIQKMRLLEAQQKYLLPAQIASTQMDLLKKHQELQQNQWLQQSLGQLMDWNGNVDTQSMATLARVAALQGKPEVAYKLFNMARLESKGALDKRVVAEYGDKRVFAIQDPGDPGKYHFVTLSNPAVEETARLNARMRMFQQAGLPLAQALMGGEAGAAPVGPVQPPGGAPAPVPAPAQGGASAPAPAPPQGGAPAPAPAQAPSSGPAEAQPMSPDTAAVAAAMSGLPELARAIQATPEYRKRVTKATKPVELAAKLREESQNILLQWGPKLTPVINNGVDVLLNFDQYRDLVGGPLGAVKGEILARIGDDRASRFLSTIESLDSYLKLTNRMLMQGQGQITDKEMEVASGLQGILAKTKSPDEVKRIMKTAVRIAVADMVGRHLLAENPVPEDLQALYRSIFGEDVEDYRKRLQNMMLSEQ